MGDVHGCAEELSRLLDVARADRVIHVGDLFTKGPDPLGVWRLVREHEAVLGNHDARLLDWLAGDRPSDVRAAACVARLDVEPDWRPWLASRPLFVEVGPFVVVHAGLHPVEGVAGTTRGMALAMRKFGETGAVWHAAYAGPPVIFGHDAQLGLVRIDRGGRPQVIGLDTGCVYGGALSGYLVESDSLLQVPAARVYQPVRPARARSPRP